LETRKKKTEKAPVGPVVTGVLVPSKAIDGREWREGGRDR